MSDYVHFEDCGCNKCLASGEAGEMRPAQDDGEYKLTALGHHVAAELMDAASPAVPPKLTRWDYDVVEQFMRTTPNGEWVRYVDAKAYAQHVAAGFDFAPIAKKLSAELKAMGADVHPSKLEMWLERELPGACESCEDWKQNYMASNRRRAQAESEALKLREALRDFDVLYQHLSTRQLREILGANPQPFNALVAAHKLVERIDEAERLLAGEKVKP